MSQELYYLKKIQSIEKQYKCMNMKKWEYWYNIITWQYKKNVLNKLLL